MRETTDIRMRAVRETERDRFIWRKWHDGLSLADIVSDLKREGFVPLTREGVRQVLKRMKARGLYE